MKTQFHVGVSLLLAWWLWSALQAWELAAASFAAGVFIDLDHLIDYFRVHGARFDLDYFFHTHYTGRYDRMYLIFHGWELPLASLPLAWYFDWNSWLLGISLGLGLHLALDQIFNRPSLWGYSLVWRWRNGFRYSTGFPRKY